ncbi:ATP-dependent RNA helicase DHX30-like [Palaemon carinicauda]|uniref:ATP-dependent RNA helicase DHX30-like n=1 Tax=Palaemon carinicauda TaxID=392227 RepID=UPI0035B5ABA6
MYLLRRLGNATSTLYTFSRVKFEKRGFAKAQSRQPQTQLQQLVRADTQYVQNQKEKVLGLFPNVKGTLNNMFNNLSSNLDSSYSCQHKTSAMGRIKNQVVYQSIFTFNWPKPMNFTGYGFGKKTAELNAMVKGLEYLYDESLITLNGHPITVSKEEKQKLLDEWSRPPVITVPSHLMEQGWKLLDEFEEAVKPYLEERNEVTFIPMSHQEDSEDEEIPGGAPLEPSSDNSDLDEDLGKNSSFVLDLLTGREYVVNPDASHSRSRELLERLNWKTGSPTQSKFGTRLPMLDYKDNLEKALDAYQVVVVAGDTGCGKSTQVPQMILDKWIKEGRGSDCNILISQPRRISAISLAKVIAQERDEKIWKALVEGKGMQNMNYEKNSQSFQRRIEVMLHVCLVTCISYVHCVFTMSS